MKTFTFALGSLLLPSLVFAQAGPPLFTDDPETPEVSTWEVNFGITTELRRDETHIEAPIADINYGLTDRIQLKYEVPWTISSRTGEGSQTGFDRSIAGVKYRFLDKEKRGFALSAYPQVSFESPVSSNLRNPQLSTDQRDYLLPIEIEQNLGVFEFNEEVGYRIMGGETNQMMYGVAGTYPIRDGFVLLSEFHGNIARDFSEDELVLNVGSEIFIAKKINALISVGRSFRDMQGTPSRYLSYVGMQFLL